MMAHKYSLGLVGDGYSICEYGLLRIIDNQVLLCGTHLAKFCEEFDGQWVELAICSPNPADPTPMDALIEPLVRKVQSLGLTTVSSCQGHIDPNIWWRHPFVTIWKPFINLPTIDSWEMAQVGINLWNLRAKGNANNEEELAALQSTIPDELAIL